jgi:hypothetical protein
MSYFMRYFLTQTTTTLAEIDAALQAADANFHIEADQSEPQTGDLYYGEAVLGEIAVNAPSEVVFDEDVEELREIIAPLDSDMKPLAQMTLDNARGMVALLVLQAGHDNPDILDALWDWMFSHHPGLLQVDDEGFYDYEGLLLPTTPEDPEA